MVGRCESNWYKSLQGLKQTLTVGTSKHTICNWVKAQNKTEVGELGEADVFRVEIAFASCKRPRDRHARHGSAGMGTTWRPDGMDKVLVRQVLILGMHICHRYQKSRRRGVGKGRG